MGQFKRQDVTEYERIDPATGEVTDKIRHINTSIITKPIGEENFIKIYYDTFLATMGKNANPLSEFLIAIGKYMVVRNNMQVIQLTKFTKEMIAEELGKSLTTIERMITTCIKEELLIRIGSGRSATYAVSPFIMSKSSSKDVQTLQLNYEARRGVLEISKPDPKKQIEQLSFTGFEPQEAEIEQE